MVVYQENTTLPGIDGPMSTRLVESHIPGIQGVQKIAEFALVLPSTAKQDAAEV